MRFFLCFFFIETIICKKLGFFFIVFRVSWHFLWDTKNSFWTIFQIFHHKGGPFWLRGDQNYLDTVFSGPTIKTPNILWSGSQVLHKNSKWNTKIHISAFLSISNECRSNEKDVPAKSRTMRSRLLCRDRNYCIEELAYSLNNQK